MAQSHYWIVNNKISYSKTNRSNTKNKKSSLGVIYIPVTNEEKWKLTCTLQSNPLHQSCSKYCESVLLLTVKRPWLNSTGGSYCYIGLHDCKEYIILCFASVYMNEVDTILEITCLLFVLSNNPITIKKRLLCTCSCIKDIYIWKLNTGVRGQTFSRGMSKRSHRPSLSSRL